MRLREEFVLHKSLPEINWALFFFFNCLLDQQTRRLLIPISFGSQFGYPFGSGRITIQTNGLITGAVSPAERAASEPLISFQSCEPRAGERCHSHVTRPLLIGWLYRALPSRTSHCGRCIASPGDLTSHDHVMILPPPRISIGPAWSVASALGPRHATPRHAMSRHARPSGAAPCSLVL